METVTATPTAPAEARTLELQQFEGGKGTVAIHIPDCLGVLDDPDEAPAPGYGAMRVMTVKDGDKRIVWNRNSMAEIREAKRVFDECVAKGMVPYRVGPGGTKSPKIMKVFDPRAEEVVFVPLKAVTGG